MKKVVFFSCFVAIVVISFSLTSCEGCSRSGRLAQMKRAKMQQASDSIQKATYFTAKISLLSDPIRRGFIVQDESLSYFKQGESILVVSVDGVPWKVSHRSFLRDTVVVETVSLKEKTFVYKIARIDSLYR